MNTKNVKRGAKKTPVKMTEKIGYAPDVSVPGIGNVKFDDGVEFRGGIMDVQNQMFLHNDPATVPDGKIAMELTNNQLAILNTVVHPHATVCMKNDPKWTRKFQYNGTERAYFHGSHMVGARRDFYRGKHGKNTVQLFAKNGDPLKPAVFTDASHAEKIAKLITV